MNKLYCIHYYIKGNYYCESSTFHENELIHELSKLPEAYLVENNDCHEIWRIDV